MQVGDDGFYSTSPDPYGGFDDEITYVVKLPKGAKGMYVDSISKHRGEQELLLQRGSQFIIEDIEQGSYSNEAVVYMTWIGVKK